MSVKQFELLHGIVLTKILRSRRQVQLTLIETNPEEAWSAYTINDTVNLFIKHRANARESTKKPGTRSWSFIFNENQLRQIGTLAAKKPVYVTLVGGAREVKDRGMVICFLRPEEHSELIHTNDLRPQSLTVRRVPGGKLRVFKDRKVKLKISASALDNWIPPGS